MKSNLDYSNKIILAPMVRVGTLPMRLLALSYGADIVYTEEIIDWKLIKTKRRVNDVLKTVDYIDQSDGNVIFRTCDIEKEKVVLQLGTANVDRALAVAKKVEQDVAAIDINMGCPKDFSIKGGMGVALLYNLEKAKLILKTLVDNVSIPITCKIRIMPDDEDTLRTVKELQSTGISAIAVHGRTKTERPRNPVHMDVIKKVREALTIPVIANGGSRDIEKYSDILAFKKACGVDSVMIARAAQWNCSIFRKQGMLPIDVIIKAYLKLAVEYDNSPSNTKYCVQMILRDLQETPMGRLFLNSQTLEQICDVFDMGAYCREKQIEYQNAGLVGRRQVCPEDEEEEDCPSKKLKLDIADDVIHFNVCFIRANYDEGKDKSLPKSKLYTHSVKNNNKVPKYEVEQKDKLFRSVVVYDDKKYCSSFWEKNRKYAEQSAALACLLHLELVDKNVLIEDGSMVA